ELIPAWRHRSLIGTPASPCLSTAMIWVSVNFDFFIQPPGGEKMPESSTYWVSTDRGSLRSGARLCAGARGGEAQDPGGAVKNPPRSQVTLSDTADWAGGPSQDPAAVHGGCDQRRSRTVAEARRTSRRRDRPAPARRRRCGTGGRRRTSGRSPPGSGRSDWPRPKHRGASTWHRRPRWSPGTRSGNPGAAGRRIARHDGTVTGRRPGYGGGHCGAGYGATSAL